MPDAAPPVHTHVMFCCGCGGLCDSKELCPMRQWCECRRPHDWWAVGELEALIEEKTDA